MVHWRGNYQQDIQKSSIRREPQNLVVGTWHYYPAARPPPSTIINNTPNTDHLESSIHRQATDPANTHSCSCLFPPLSFFPAIADVGVGGIRLDITREAGPGEDEPTHGDRSGAGKTGTSALFVPGTTRWQTRWARQVNPGNSGCLWSRGLVGREGWWSCRACLVVQDFEKCINNSNDPPPRRSSNTPLPKAV